MQHTYNRNGSSGSTEAAFEPADTVEVYLREISRLPTLAADEEAAIAARLERGRFILRRAVFATIAGISRAHAILLAIEKNPSSLDQYVRVSGKSKKRAQLIEEVAALSRELSPFVSDASPSNGDSSNGNGANGKGPNGKGPNGKGPNGKGSNGKGSNGKGSNGNGTNGNGTNGNGGNGALTGADPHAGVEPDVLDRLAAIEFHMATVRSMVEQVHQQQVHQQAGPSATIDNAFAQYRESVSMLCTGHLGLVVAIARQFPAGDFLPLGDLIQEGNTGLLQAADRYGVTSGDFAAFARGIIQEAMRKFAIDQSRLVRIPPALLKLIRRLILFRRDFSDENGRLPTSEEAAKKLAVTLDEIDLLDRLDHTTISIDEPLDEQDMSSVGDMIEDPKPKPQIDDIQRSMLQSRLTEALKTLSVRERNVLRLRFGLSEGRHHTIAEVSEKLQVTPKRVRKLQTAAFHKLRDSEYRAELEAMMDALD